MVFRKVWICHRSSRHKSKHITYRNTGCLATLDIQIKLVTKGTKRNDMLLRRNPPLRCIIIIKGLHNHNTESSQPLIFLRVKSETATKFYKYFDYGMTPADSMKYHEAELLLHEDGHMLVADASVNPAAHTIYYLYSKWRAAKDKKIAMEKLNKKLKEHHSHVSLNTK